MLLVLTNCRDFLNEKSDSKLTTIESVADLQALLDNFGFLNTEFASSGETSADDYFLTDEQYNSLNFEEDKRLYTWMPDNVAKPASLGNNWMSCYRPIYICNAVLYDLDTHSFTGKDAENVRGQALALRASRYLDAVQIWCLAYDPANADETLGLPLRLDPDMNTPSKRATLQQTYEQILSDLSQAAKLLPEKQISRWRISRDVAYGLMSRAYLFMGDYHNALLYAQKALNISNKLMDFSELDPSLEYPIKELNDEVLFLGAMTYEYHLIPARIKSDFYNLYDNEDIRKRIFFKKTASGEFFFKGYYNNMGGPNTSVTVDELYLIIAESQARNNKISESMSTLNALLITRWDKGTFVPFTANSQSQALEIILRERRKELLIRGLRWADIKRYNRSGANITLTRIVNGKIYQLPPNDLRYAIAIPEEIIKLSGIQQNPR